MRIFWYVAAGVAVAFTLAAVGWVVYIVSGLFKAVLSMH